MSFNCDFGWNFGECIRVILGGGTNGRLLRLCNRMIETLGCSCFFECFPGLYGVILMLGGCCGYSVIIQDAIRWGCRYCIPMLIMELMSSIDFLTFPKSGFGCRLHKVTSIMYNILRHVLCVIRSILRWRRFSIRCHPLTLFFGTGVGVSDMAGDHGTLVMGFNRFAGIPHFD